MVEKIIYRLYREGWLSNLNSNCICIFEIMVYNNLEIDSNSKMIFGIIEISGP